MGTADPDAIWKPGFTGENVYPSREPAVATGGGRRGRLLGLGALLVAAAGGLGAVAIARGDRPTDPAAMFLPESPSLRWTVELPGGGVNRVGGSARGLVVAADERDRQVIAVDATSGEERWRAALPDGGWVGQLVVVDDLVVAVVADGDPVIVGYEADDGDRRWERPAQHGVWLLPTGRLTFVGAEGDRSSNS